MKKVELPNLRFKKTRVGQITRAEVFPMPPFDTIAWSKFSNFQFGPNYIVDEEGEVTQVLPEELVGTSNQGQLVPDEVVSIFAADTPKAKESLKALLERWDRKGSPSEAAERSEDAKVAKESETKKGKKG